MMLFHVYLAIYSVMFSLSIKILSSTNSHKLIIPMLKLSFLKGCSFSFSYFINISWLSISLAVLYFTSGGVKKSFYLKHLSDLLFIFTILIISILILTGEYKSVIFFGSIKFIKDGFRLHRLILL